MMAILASVLFAAAAEVPLKPLVAPAFETRVGVAPSSQDPYQLLKRSTPWTYTCSAILLEPHVAGKTDRAYGAVKLVVAPGESETKSAHTSMGLDMTFTTKIDAKRERADWTLTIEREGQLVSRQKSTVWLQPPGKNVPAQ